MRIAIFGGGSIGQRHAANARALGHDVAVVDIDPTRGTPPSAFDPSGMDAVLICTPAASHEDTAWSLPPRYCGPLFVEKPLTLNRFRRFAPSFFEVWPHPVTMVGYNWRFHPELAPLQLLAKRGMSLHFDVRTDVATWPGANYADPIFECSHEIDLACHWLGAPSAVLGGELAGSHGPGAWVQMQHPRGDSVIDVRWQTEPQRTVTAHLSTGRGVTRGRTSYLVSLDVRPEAPALNESYVDELRHFLACVESGATTLTPFTEGLRVVEICERVKELAV